MENRYTVSGCQKDPEALHLYVKDVRILTPHEYETLCNAIPKDKHRTLFDILLVTGCSTSKYFGFTHIKSGTTQNEILFICLRKLKRSKSESNLNEIYITSQACFHEFSRTFGKEYEILKLHAKSGCETHDRKWAKEIWV